MKRTNEAMAFIYANTTIDYDSTLLEAGIEFAHHFWPNPQIRKLAQGSPLYWNWFAIQWEMRTLHIISALGIDITERALNRIEKEALVEAYYAAHEVEVLVGLYPARVIRDGIFKNIKTA